jgi:hypothetical protein
MTTTRLGQLAEAFTQARYSGSKSSRSATGA